MQFLSRFSSLSMAGFASFVLYGGCGSSATPGGTGNPCLGVTCGGHGQCVIKQDGTAACMCDNGFTAVGLTCVPAGDVPGADHSWEVQQNAEIHEDVNYQPTIASLTVTPPIVMAKSSAAVTCKAVDPDGDPLTYYWSSTAGTFINQVGPQVSWTAPDMDGTATITVKVVDQYGANTTKSITLDIEKPVPGNSPPVVTALRVVPDVAPPGSQVSVEAAVSDTDDDELSFTWLASDGLIDGEGASANWILPAMLGKYYVTLVVQDPKGASGSATTSMTVKEVPKNNPPVISQGPTIHPQNVELGSTGIVTVVASDPDGDQVNYAWSATGGTIIGAGTSVVWKAPDTTGEYTISVVVSDGKGGKATGTVTANAVLTLIDEKFDNCSVGNLGDWIPGVDNQYYSYSCGNGKLEIKGMNLPKSEIDYTFMLSKNLPTPVLATMDWVLLLSLDTGDPVNLHWAAITADLRSSSTDLIEVGWYDGDYGQNAGGAFALFLNGNRVYPDPIKEPHLWKVKDMLKGSATLIVEKKGTLLTFRVGNNVLYSETLVSWNQASTGVALGITNAYYYSWGCGSCIYVGQGITRFLFQITSGYSKP